MWVSEQFGDLLKGTFSFRERTFCIKFEVNFNWCNCSIQRMSCVINLTRKKKNEAFPVLLFDQTKVWLFWIFLNIYTTFLSPYPHCPLMSLTQIIQLSVHVWQWLVLCYWQFFYCCFSNRSQRGKLKVSYLRILICTSFKYIFKKRLDEGS